jgi:hypothetical protein
LFQTGDVSDEGAAVGVDDLDFSAIRKVDVARGRIDRDVIEILAGAIVGPNGLNSEVDNVEIATVNA